MLINFDLFIEYAGLEVRTIDERPWTRPEERCAKVDISTFRRVV